MSVIYRLLKQLKSVDLVSHRFTFMKQQFIPPTSRKKLAQAAPEAEVVGLRQRVLDAAVEALIEVGSAKTTTLEVQRRAKVSRGALLHHFPTHADLLSSTVSELVRRNEQSVHASAQKLDGTGDDLERAVRVLALALAEPSYLAELELWTVARTDPDLRQELRMAERGVRSESDRVARSLFTSIGDHPEYTTITTLTVIFLRGLSVSGILGGSARQRSQLISDWVRMVKLLLEAPLADRK